MRKFDQITDQFVSYLIALFDCPIEPLTSSLFISIKDNNIYVYSEKIYGNKVKGKRMHIFNVCIMRYVVLNDDEIIGILGRDFHFAPINQAHLIQRLQVILKILEGVLDYKQLNTEFLNEGKPMLIGTIIRKYSGMGLLIEFTLYEEVYHVVLDYTKLTDEQEARLISENNLT